jgi:hypothetical protein
VGGGTYDAKIYTGDLTGVATRVLGAGDPVVGATGYCYSGQKTGSGCSKTVSSLNGMFCDDHGCTSGVIVASGGPLPQVGDSGSPFYLPSPNGVLIRGLLFATINGNIYAEKWTTIRNLWGLTIVTS